jgi:hypothetical protein
MTRKPSCLISCSHISPEGGRSAFVGRHGAINPAGRSPHAPYFAKPSVRTGTVSDPDRSPEHVTAGKRCRSGPKVFALLRVQGPGTPPRRLVAGFSFRRAIQCADRLLRINCPAEARPQRGLEAMRAAFDYPLTAKARLSRNSRLGTHTRSIRAHFRAAQSSPPRPLWFYIADMESRSSKRLSRWTRPLACDMRCSDQLWTGVCQGVLRPM